jgi:hypothetical protein
MSAKTIGRHGDAQGIAAGFGVKGICDNVISLAATRWNSLSALYNL